MILEHPAASRHVDRASVWRTGIMKVLTSTTLLRTFTFAQWQFGATGIKPTTLLLANVSNFSAILYGHADEHATRPVKALIGRQDGTNTFCAAAAYPDRLNAGLADALVHKWLPILTSGVNDQRDDNHLTDTTRAQIHALASECKAIKEGQCRLPDFQGR